MRNFITTVIIMITFTGVLTGQSRFERTYGTATQETGKAITKTANDQFFVLGQTDSAQDSNRDFYLVHSDSSGKLLSQHFYASRGVETAYDLYYNKYLWLLGTTQVPGQQIDIFLLQLNKAGDTLQKHFFGQTGGNNHDIGRKILSPADSLLVLGGSTRSQGNGKWDFYFLRIDTTGNKVTEVTYGGPQKDRLHDFIITADKGYLSIGRSRSFGAGNTSNNGRNYNAYLVKTDSNHDTLWTRTFGDSLTQDYGIDAVQHADSTYSILLERDPPQEARSLFLYHLSKKGNYKGKKAIYRKKGDRGFDLIKTPDKKLAFTGYTSVDNQGFNILLKKLNINGSTIWSQTYGGSQNETGVFLKAWDNSFGIVGSTEGFGINTNFNMYFISTDSLGQTSCPDHLSFQPSDTALCNNNLISFTNTSVGSKGFYWQFPDTSYVDTRNIDYYFDTSGTFAISLSTCRDTVQQYVSVHPLPNLQFGANTDSTSVLFYLKKASPALTSIRWEFGDNTVDTTRLAPYHNYDSLGAYQVVVSANNKYGCFAQNSQRINLYPPSVNSRRNSLFTSPSLTIKPHPLVQKSTITISAPPLQGFELKIYNTNGQLVKKMRSSNNKLELYRQQLKEGIYFYELTTDEERQFNGKLLVY